MIISDQLIIRNIDQQTMIINLKNGKVTVLDEIGTLFWNSIVNNTSFAEFIITMQNRYDVEESVLKNDYIVFIEKLKDAGIIW
mgnify:CR=1 FL=1